MPSTGRRSTNKNKICKVSIIRFQKWLVADFFFVDRLLRSSIFGQIEIIGMPPFPVPQFMLDL